MSSEVINQAVGGGLRALPPVGISAASFLGVSLEDWMYIATISYTVLQGAYLVYRWRGSHKRHKEKRNAKDNRE